MMLAIQLKMMTLVCSIGQIIIKKITALYIVCVCARVCLFVHNGRIMGYIFILRTHFLFSLSKVSEGSRSSTACTPATG